MKPLDVSKLKKADRRKTILSRLRRTGTESAARPARPDRRPLSTDPDVVAVTIGRALRRALKEEDVSRPRLYTIPDCVIEVDPELTDRFMAADWPEPSGSEE